MVRKAGLEVVDYLPYGAFPAFFYFFAGAAFKLLKGKGLNLSRRSIRTFSGRSYFPDPGLRESNSTSQCRPLSATGGRI